MVEHCVLSVFASLLTVLGIGSVVCGIVLVTSDYSFYGHNYEAFSCGGWMILAGIFGFIGGCTKIRAFIITYLVMSILAAIFAPAPLMWAYGYWASKTDDGVYVACVTLAIIGAISLITTILAASFACCFVCSCCRNKNQNATGPVEPINGWRQPVQPPPAQHQHQQFGGQHQHGGAYPKQELRPAEEDLRADAWPAPSAAHPSNQDLYTFPMPNQPMA